MKNPALLPVLEDWHINPEVVKKAMDTYIDLQRETLKITSPLLSENESRRMQHEIADLCVFAGMLTGEIALRKN